MIRHRKIGSLLGGPASASLAMGLNLSGANYFDNTFVTNDMRFGDNTRSRPSGNPIPPANMNSSHQVTSMPAGDTSLSFHCRPPEAANTTVDATFTGGNVVSSLSMTNANIVSGPDYVAGTVSVVPTVNQPSTIGFVFQMTPSGSTMPQLLTCIPRGSSGTLSPSSVTNFAALTNSNGPLRVMKRAGVEANEGVHMTDISQAFPAAKLTSSNRNTTSSQDWLGNDGTSGGLVNDGEPMEESIAIAQAAGRPLWRTLPWNADNTYYDAMGDLAAAAAKSTGLVTYFEQSNEVWNSSYWVNNQAMYEGLQEGLTGVDGSAINTFTGSISGTTLTISGLTGPGLAASMLISGAGVSSNTKIVSGSGTTWTVNNSQTVGSIAMKGGWRYLERHIEKTCQVMDRIKARYVAAGAPLSCLKRVFAWQNGGISTGLMDQILTYAPPSYTALSNHIDVFATAPYITQESVAVGDTTPADFNNALYDSMDSIVDTQLGILASKCTQYGLSPACYEYGQSCFISDGPTRTSVQETSTMYAIMMHVFARTAAQIPGAPVCNFVYCNPDNTSSPYDSWGIMQGTYQTPSSSTPKYNAQVDFAAGKRKIIPLIGTFGSTTVTAGATVGTALGYLKRRTPGSTITLQANPGTAVAITDPTAQILQFTIATAAAFASSGTINVTVRETDPRDPAGYVDNAFTIQVGAGLSNPAVTTDGVSTATLKATTTASSGTRYAIVSTSATPPSTAQIKAGQDSTGSAAAWSNGGVTITSSGVQTDTTSATLANTTQYYAYWLVNTGGADSAVLSYSGGFKVNQVTNGDMSSSTGWIVNVGTISGGIYSVTSGGNMLYQTGVLTVGLQYTVSFTYTSTSGNSIRFTNSASANTNVVSTQSVTTDGASHTWTATFTAIGTAIGIEASGATFTGTIDNVVVHLS